MDKVFGGLPYALAIMLTTSFTKGFCTFTDRVFISPSVPTDNFDLPMDNWFTICTDRTRGAGRSIIGGANIHIFVFTDCKNN